MGGRSRPQAPAEEGRVISDSDSNDSTDPRCMSTDPEPLARSVSDSRLGLGLRDSISSMTLDSSLVSCSGSIGGASFRLVTRYVARFSNAGYRSCSSRSSSQESRSEVDLWFTFGSSWPIAPVCSSSAPSELLW